ncbi:MAG: hypothetical protein LBN34_00445 [Clostridiales Family XIII bacterium]|jgi:hypothetical protein|nr:hypothetical protein [Clostridiales Family XIII bacterium]
MKNQYVADIGDYGKCALLRAFIDNGFALGLNWYLTLDDDSKDGRHTDYLSSSKPYPDEGLRASLCEIFENGFRNVSSIENSGLLQNTIFYHDVLDFDVSKPAVNRLRQRGDWHNNAIQKLSGCDIVFLDPDTGLEVKSVNPISKDGNRYATNEEVMDYFNKGQNVIIYQHGKRISQVEQDTIFYEFGVRNNIPKKQFRWISFRPYSVRYYLMLIQKRDVKRVNNLIDELLNRWDPLFQS